MDVRVTQGLGAEVAVGGVAGQQRPAEVIHGADGALGGGLVARLVQGAGFSVGVQEDVGVGVDEAGQDVEAAEVDVGGGDVGGEGGGALVEGGDEAGGGGYGEGDVREEFFEGGGEEGGGVDGEGGGGGGGGGAG